MTWYTSKILIAEAEVTGFRTLMAMVERCTAITKVSVSHPVDMRGRCEVERSHDSLLDTLIVNVYCRSFLEVIA